MAATDLEILTLKRLQEDLRNDIRVLSEQLGMGAASDWSDYRFMVGRISAFDLIVDTLQAQIRRATTADPEFQKDDDDDDEPRVYSNDKAITEKNANEETNR